MKTTRTFDLKKKGKCFGNTNTDKQVNMYFMLVLLLALMSTTAYGFHSNLIHTASTILDSLSTIASVTTAITCIQPVNSKHQWTVYNDELKEELKPIHGALANNIIDP